MFLLSAQEKISNEQIRKFQQYFECHMPFKCGDEDPINQFNVKMMEIKKKAIANRIAGQSYVDNNKISAVVDDENPIVQVDCFVGEKLLVHIKKEFIPKDSDPVVSVPGQVSALKGNQYDDFNSYLFEAHYVRSLLGLKQLEKNVEMKKMGSSQHGGISKFSTFNSNRSPSPSSLEEGIDNRYLQIQDSESTKSNSEERCAKCVML